MISSVWRHSVLRLCLLAAILGGPALAAEPVAANRQDATARRQLAVAVLRAALVGQPQWIKVHAAEFLLALDYRTDVREVFEQELAEHGDEPEYRIGIWRVLAREALDDQRRDHFVSLIRAAFLDPAGPDRLHAAETLAKLDYQVGSVLLDPGDEAAAKISPEQQARLQQAEWDAFAAAADGEEMGLRACARWVLLNSATDPQSRRSAELRLAALLTDSPERSRSLAAYAFTWQPTIAVDVWNQIQQATETEPKDSTARVYLVAATILHAATADADATDAIRELLQVATAGTAAEQYQACATLATAATSENLPALLGLLEDEQTSPDVQVAAASAICRIGRRLPRPLAALDWIIICVYGIGMVLVGWYYSRRTATTEDYLLGGRNMRPWAVGLSLFATLLSTISYLAQPGEMIKNGPMIFCQVLAYPLIVLTVCTQVIPLIMGLKVTSAYELLEKRFGLSVRLLGAIIFLLLRLLWMSVIVFATTDKVLIPLLGLDPSIWSPILCAILGVITVIYTSLGGLRAVVVTDVVQTVILFGGAILALITITVSMGGVSAWWPHQWSPRWAPPALGFQTDARVTLGWAMVSTFIWYVCTSASDQMAIQRYLATRDVKSARRAFVATMICDALVTSLLAMLGLALFAYFQANPFYIPDGMSLQENADQLFPQFIVFGLPVGVTGLVVAGLLAAAMSSLSSGMNSSCAVITTDFIDRFKRDAFQETNHVALARYVSLAVGAVVVGLSLFVSLAPGNLLEVAFKVVNLFVVPLFMLFFMAMYVSWATSFGAWTAAICSGLAAIVIAYWSLFASFGPTASLMSSVGLSPADKAPSFLFIMPAALVVGVVVGPLVSLLPIGPAAKQSLREITRGDFE